MSQLTADALLTIGFRDVAKWVKAHNGSLAYELDGANASAHGAMFDVRNALYAFVQGLRYGEFEIDLTAGLAESLIVAFAQPAQQIDTADNLSYSYLRNCRRYGTRRLTAPNLGSHAEFATRTSPVDAADPVLVDATATRSQLAWGRLPIVSLKNRLR